YVVNPDAPGTEPARIADNAAFPAWDESGARLFFLGARGADGLYTKLFRIQPGIDKQPAELLGGLRASVAQSVDSPRRLLFLIAPPSDPRPGSPVRARIYNAFDGKSTDLANLGDMYGPALAFNGKMLVYGTRTAGHPILMAFELNGPAPVPVFPTPETKES